MIFFSFFVETTDGAKKIRYRQKISDYMDRAEQIKQQVCKEKEAGKYHEQIKIPDNGIGYSYSKLFQPYLDNTLKEVWVNDPYIRQIHQITNLQRFCEMLLKGPAKVKIINLLTTQDDMRHTKEQTNSLEELRKSLQNYGVILNIKYSNTLHDREIRFNNGWIIKIGRGLDYFKKHQGRFSIGYWDYDLRQCHETTVDIFHCQQGG
uniref:MIT, microtubule interacting and transport, domain containing 1 n=1 Tax=Eptatretus burgeri TaxID=7764 RepID=A0A8C4X0D9_EPTBU